MEKQRRSDKMLGSTIVMTLLALVLIYVGYRKGNGAHILGLKTGLLFMVKILPLLFVSFLVAGLIQVMVPKEIISMWIGEESGTKGMLLAAVAGFLIPGGPYVVLPILAGLLQQGISIGSAMAFYTAKFLCGLTRLPIEFSILGWKFIIIRIVITSIIPILTGIIAEKFFGGFF